MDGILKAKQKGVKFGASKKLTDEQIKEMKEKRPSRSFDQTFDEGI